jgi:hypothetical protein
LGLESWNQCCAIFRWFGRTTSLNRCAKKLRRPLLETGTLNANHRISGLREHQITRLY